MNGNGNVVKHEVEGNGNGNVEIDGNLHITMSTNLDTNLEVILDTNEMQTSTGLQYVEWLYLYSFVRDGILVCDEIILGICGNGEVWNRNA